MLKGNSWRVWVEIACAGYASVRIRSGMHDVQGGASRYEEKQSCWRFESVMNVEHGDEDLFLRFMNERDEALRKAVRDGVSREWWKRILDVGVS